MEVQRTWDPSNGSYERSVRDFKTCIVQWSWYLEMVLLGVIISGILVGGVYALFSVGLSVLLGAMRVFNIAHGTILTASAFVAIEVARMTGWSAAPLLVVGAFTGMCLGIPLEMLAIRPFRRGKVFGGDMETGTMLTTLAFVLVGRDLITHFTQAQTWSFPFGSYPTFAVSLGALRVGVMYVIAFALSIVLILLAAVVLKFTQPGRAVRGIASDHRAASLLGINVNRYSLGTAMVSSGLAGLAGALLAMAFAGVSYDTGDNLLFLGFIIVVLGGIGSVPGTLIAAIALGIVESIGNFYSSGNWGEILAFALLVLVIVFRPQGLLGKPAIVRT